MAYRLTHPDTGQEIEVRADQVPTYEGQGWQTRPAARPVEAPPTPAPEGGVTTRTARRHITTA